MEETPRLKMRMPPIIRAAFHAHGRVQYSSKRPSLTQQSSRDECDINVIMKRFQQTGLLDHVKEQQGQYADVADVGDFQTAQNMVAQATTVFESLPSGIRADFDNDPAKFFDFAADPENLDAMQEMGLIPPAEPADATKASSAPTEPEAPIKPAEGSETAPEGA